MIFGASKQVGGNKLRSFGHSVKCSPLSENTYNERQHLDDWPSSNIYEGCLCMTRGICYMVMSQKFLVFIHSLLINHDNRRYTGDSKKGGVAKVC